MPRKPSLLIWVTIMATQNPLWKFSLIAIASVPMAAVMNVPFTTGVTTNNLVIIYNNYLVLISLSSSVYSLL